jgi:hypothetical protein
VPELHSLNGLNFEPVSGCQGAVQELRTELVEAVPHLAVARRKEQQPPAGPEQPHAVGEGNRKVEDVFERSPVDDRIELLLEMSWNRQVHVVNDRGSLVGSEIEGHDVRRAEQSFQKLVRVGLNTRVEGGGVEAELVSQRTKVVPLQEELLVTKGQRGAKRAIAPRFEKELCLLISDAHKSPAAIRKMPVKRLRAIR